MLDVRGVLGDMAYMLPVPVHPLAEGMLFLGEYVLYENPLRDRPPPRPDTT
jgi:hypothetical protein